MLKYNSHLKQPARRLRAEMTESERRLWSRLRGKQLLNVQFYRQKPIGSCIVDFYAPSVKLVVEVDGSQHRNEDHVEQDFQRDEWLTSQGLKVIRFTNLEVFNELDVVAFVVLEALAKQAPEEIHPAPLCERGAKIRPSNQSADR